MLNKDDLVFEAYPLVEGGMVAGVPKGIKVTHKPSGNSVVCEKFNDQYKNKEQALEWLCNLTSKLK
jgi:protein subunit release factor A